MGEGLMTAAVREDVVVEDRECQWPVEKLPPNTIKECFVKRL